MKTYNNSVSKRFKKEKMKTNNKKKNKKKEEWEEERKMGIYLAYIQLI